MNACSATRTTASQARLADVQASPQWRDGKFQNTLPRHDGPMTEMLTKWLAGVDHTVPATPLPVMERDGAELAKAPQSGLRITWLGHSTILVSIDGYRVLVDPILSERASPFSWIGPKRFYPPPLAFQALPKIDVVLISHDHYDHLDQRTIVRLKDTSALFVVPLGVGAHLESWGVPLARIVERDWWGEAQVGELTLTATPARHFSGRSLVMANRDQTLWAGWVMRGPEHRVYYSGDTAMFPGFAEIGERLGPFDAALIETGAYNRLWPDVHIGPEQAVQAHRMVRGGLYIPVHWGTFDLALHSWTEPVERLLVAAAKDGVPVVVPRPGESIEPATPPQLVRWWPELPWQSAKESPVVSTGLCEPLAMGPTHGADGAPATSPTFPQLAPASLHDSK